MCSRRELGKPSENILSGYLIVQMVTVKMAPVLVPKISPELYPIKKLSFKLFSCFGACLEDSMVRYCFSFDKDFSLLPCMGYVLFMFSTQLGFCFLEMAAVHSDLESHCFSTPVRMK